ncbi:MAG: sortase A, partial [Oceanicoccus sp.]
MNGVNKHWRSSLLMLLLLAGLVKIADAAVIHLKAALAQQLIKQAWQQSRDTGLAVKPWPWADTWPVVRLQAPQSGEDLYVLRGAQGSALAFGPGWLDDSVSPDQSGTKIIAGHRDTHFTFLQNLKKSDELILINAQGELRHYTVTSIEIIDSSKQQLLIDSQQEQLVLISCYPFNTLEAGGPLRYIVTALPVANRQ